MAQRVPVERPAPSERAHLVIVHDELCTALTSLRSNLDLVRFRLAKERISSSVDPLLQETGDAIDRLTELAREVKRWHAEGR
jgi:hypothetical protein